MRGIHKSIGMPLFFFFCFFFGKAYAYCLGHCFRPEAAVQEMITKGVIVKKSHLGNGIHKSVYS